MTLTQRRILYITFILLFLIITPTISFYAAGYDFNFSNKQIQRTGIVILETEPKGAHINLGEGKKFNWLYNFFYQDQVLETPLKLRNLLPDDYELTLDKDGYFPYERKIKLNAGETMVLDDILLFKQSNPNNIIKQNILSSKLSPDKKKLALFTNLNLIIFNLETGQQNKIELKPTTLSRGDLEIFWAPSSKKVLLNYGKLPVYNIENSQLELEIQDFFDDSINQIKWDDFSDNEIYIQHSNILHKFNLAQKKAELFINKKITNDFFIRDNNLLSINKIDNENFINIYRNENLLKTILVPPANNYSFDKFDDKIIYLKDERHNILHLINPWLILPLQDSINNVREFTIINSQLLYWNDLEIWLYDMELKNKTLLTRVSEKINRALWHPDGNYIIYNTDKGIYVIEMENNSYINLIKISNWQNTSDLFLSADNESLFFVSSLGEKRALYEMEIK